MNALPSITSATIRRALETSGFELPLSHSHALEIIAISTGHSCWRALTASQPRIADQAKQVAKLLRSGKDAQPDKMTLDDVATQLNALRKQAHPDFTPSQATIEWLKDEEPEMRAVGELEKEGVLYLALEDPKSKKVECRIYLGGKDYSQHSGCYAADCGRAFLRLLSPPAADEHNYRKWRLWVEATEDFGPLLDGLIQNEPLGTVVLIEPAKGDPEYLPDDDLPGMNDLRLKVIREDNERCLEGDGCDTPAICELATRLAYGARLSVTRPGETKPHMARQFSRTSYCFEPPRSPDVTPTSGTQAWLDALLRRNGIKHVKP